MSSYFEFLGYTIIYPRIKISFLNPSGELSTFEPKVVKWYFISSLVVGAYVAFRILRKLTALMQKSYRKYMPLLLKDKNLAVVFGFGDSIASVKLTKALINMGFNLILINRKRSIEYRRKSSLNKEDNIGEVDKTDFYVSYESILENPDLLKNLIRNDKIEFIFDFTDFSLFGNRNSSAIKTEDKDDCLSDKFNFTLREKRSSWKININEKFDGSLNESKRAQTYSESFGNTKSLRRLNKEALSKGNSNILYAEEISRHVNEIIFICEYMFQFMRETKVMIFNYADRERNLNHKLMLDFKIKFFSNLKNIASKKHNFISYVKVIDSVFASPDILFSEKDGMTIIRFSDLEDFEYSFY